MSISMCAISWFEGHHSRKKSGKAQATPATSLMMTLDLLLPLWIEIRVWHIGITSCPSQGFLNLGNFSHLYGSTCRFFPSFSCLLWEISRLIYYSFSPDERFLVAICGVSRPHVLPTQLIQSIENGAAARLAAKQLVG